MAVTSLVIDVGGATVADVGAWMRGVSDVAMSIARGLSNPRRSQLLDLVGAVERVAEEAHAAAMKAEEVDRG